MGRHSSLISSLIPYIIFLWGCQEPEPPKPVDTSPVCLDEANILNFEKVNYFIIRNDSLLAVRDSEEEFRTSIDSPYTPLFLCKNTEGSGRPFVKGVNYKIDSNGRYVVVYSQTDSFISGTYRVLTSFNYCKYENLADTVEVVFGDDYIKYKDRGEKITLPYMLIENIRSKNNRFHFLTQTRVYCRFIESRRHTEKRPVVGSPIKCLLRYGRNPIRCQGLNSYDYCYWGFLFEELD